jgi:hypothetical protein
MGGLYTLRCRAADDVRHFVELAGIILAGALQAVDNLLELRLNAHSGLF